MRSDKKNVLLMKIAVYKNVLITQTLRREDEKNRCGTWAPVG